MICMDSKRIRLVSAIAVCAFFILCNFAVAIPPVLKPHQVGQYAGKAWGDPLVPPEQGSWADRTNLLRYTIRSVNVNQDDPNNWPDFSGVLQEVYDGQGYNPKRTILFRVHFWDGADRYTLPMRDISVYKARLDYACSQLVPVMDLIHGITLSEENVPYDGHGAVLEELYWHVKNQYPNLPIYQWWSPNTGIPTTYDGIYLSADGWVIDPYTLCVEMYPATNVYHYNDDNAAYSMGPDPYTRLLRKYVITGKPVLSMLCAASESFADWYDISTTPYPPAVMWDIVEHQRTMNTAFNVSTNYYWVHGTAYFPMETGDPLQDAITVDVRDHCWEMILLDPSWNGDASIADIWDNTPVTISFGGSQYFEDHFTNPKLVDYTSGSGFRDLVLNGEDLRVRGYDGRSVDVEIVYNFLSGTAMEFPETSVQADIDATFNGYVKLSASADGLNWLASTESQPVSGVQNLTLDIGDQQALASVNSFWLKIEITGDAGTIDDPAVILDDLSIVEGTEIIGCGSWGYQKSDLNEDCQVDSKDFAILSSKWLECTDPNNPADCVNVSN